MFSPFSHKSQFTLLLLLLLALPSAYAFAQQPPDGLPVPELCDILNRPEEYTGKEYKVQAEFVAGFEMGWLEDTKKCEREIPLRAIRVITDPKLNTATSPRIYRKFTKRLNSRPTSPKRIGGIFNIRVEHFESAGNTDKRFEYQIRILSVERVD